MVGIIVVNYKSYDNTIKCVDSIIGSNPENKYYIYIVDNHSCNESCERLSEYYDKERRVKIIELEENRGYSSGINSGIKNAKKDGCKYFLACNNDLLFKKHTIDYLVKAYNSNENYGVVGPKVIGIDGKYQQSYKVNTLYTKHLLSKKPLYYLNRRESGYVSGNKDYEFNGMVAGCCFLFGENLIDKIGYLDENVFLYYEEDILGYKLSKNGYLAAVIGNAEVIHFGSTTIGSDSVTNYLYRYISSMYFYRTYINISKIQLFVLLLINGMSLFAKSLKRPEFREALHQLIIEYKRLTK
ncbi:glycosyltransferase [Faecalibaculum rodentium]|uniref:glycosyltransferase n=1 Tax=Faecalibaculum rodentium TaxID=1702221 RepID=UPI001F5AA2D3|nr:glycosyltransferase [Faecalibaculum rodentium]